MINCVQLHTYTEGEARLKEHCLPHRPRVSHLTDVKVCTDRSKCVKTKCVLK